MTSLTGNVLFKSFLFSVRNPNPLLPKLRVEVSVERVNPFNNLKDSESKEDSSHPYMRRGDYQRPSL